MFKHTLKHPDLEKYRMEDGTFTYRESLTLHFTDTI